LKHLLYIADPMCSWCYGFGPELSALLARHPGMQVDLVMGGLRAYSKNVMDAAMKDTLRGHWEHVSQASGQPFSQALFERDDFVYNTEPACRAVVVARSQAPELALSLMRAIQTAFYRDGRDVTQGDVLADIAAETGLPRDLFIAAWNSQEAEDAARADFISTQRLGVQGFPTLAMLENSQFYLIANGYTKADVLDERLGKIAALAAERAAAKAVSAAGQ
jgi:putative protein-disulfide isomerase